MKGREKEERRGLKGMGRKGRLGEGKEREGSGGRGVCPLPSSPGYATTCAHSVRRALHQITISHQPNTKH